MVSFVWFVLFVLSVIWAYQLIAVIVVNIRELELNDFVSVAAVIGFVVFAGCKMFAVV